MRKWQTIALMMVAAWFLSAPASAQPRLTDDLFSVSFANAKDGWAAGRWGTVLHTADGGQTWEKQKTGVDFTLSSVSFVDPQNGWAVGDEGADHPHFRRWKDLGEAEKPGRIVSDGSCICDEREG